MALCSGRHITEMQLFHELKQRFPSVPDRLVTHCIKQTRGNRAACACILEAETILSSYKMSGRPNSLQLESDPPFLEDLSASHSAPATPSINRKLSMDRISCTTPSSPVIDIGKPLQPPVVRSAIMPDVKPISHQTQQLIRQQLARKKMVENELKKYKQIVKELRANEEGLQRKLALLIQSPELATLMKEVSILRDQVTKLYEEAAKVTSVINCRVSQQADVGALAGRSHWYCSSCTFRNHPLLNNCEECNTPNMAFLDVGDSQNIHIHVTHHNFPSCSLRPCCARCYVECFDEIDYGGP